MCKIAFDDRINREYYCDNCIYNRGEADQILVFKTYNVIAKLGMIYAGTAEYSDLQLSSERQKLLARNPLEAQ